MATKTDAPVAARVGAMPSQAELDEIADRFQAVFDSLEDVERKTRLYGEEHEEAAPTPAEIGQLYSFARRLRLQLAQTSREVREIEGNLELLDSCRLDLEYTAQRGSEERQ